MKAVILARVSTEEQREAGNSLPAQTDRIKNYCSKKSFPIIKNFSFDESAYKIKRDEFDKLLDYVKDATQKEKIAVCFDKVDRLSRSVFDKRVGMLFEMALAGKIELHFVSDGQIINDQISAVEKFQFSMSLGLAKYYSDAISDNVKRAFEQKRRKGEWSGKPRIGYKNDTDIDDNKVIVIDVQRAHLVVKIFELYATANYSYDAVLEKVTALGLKSIDGKKLTRSSIEKILKDTFYCGIAQTKKYGSYPHKYEKLITKELFDRCEQVRLKRSKGPYKTQSKEYIFKGLLKCEECGCSMTPETHKKKSGLVFTYYVCTNAKKVCKRIYVPEETLLEPIYEVLGRFESISEATQDKIVKELRKTTEAEIAFHKAQINRIRIEQDQYTQRKDSLLDLLLDKSITKEQYDKKLQTFSDKLQSLNLEFEEHTRADCDYQTTVATVFSLARRAKSIFESSETNEKRAFINYLLQNPTVKSKDLHFTMRSPFDLVLELADCPSGQGRRESNPHLSFWRGKFYH